MTDTTARLVIEADARQVRSASDELNKLSRVSRETEQATNRFASASSSSFSIVARAAGAMSAAFAGFSIASLIKETTALNQSFNQASIVMQQVGRNAGYTAKEIDDVAKAVQKSGISMIESRNTVTKLASANIDLANASKLARLAQDAAVIGQINSSEALGRLIHGITSAQVEVLRGIGLNVNFEQSYKKLADEIGKNVNQLSEAEKAQARLNVTFEAGENIAGSYEASLESAGKMYGSTARHVEDLKVKVGQLFDQSAMFAVTAYTQALKETNSAIDELTQSGELQAWGDAIARTLAFMTDGFRSFIITVDLAGKKLGAMAAKTEAFFRGDFASIRIIDEDFSKDFDAGIASMSKMRDIVESQIISRDMLTKVTERNTIATRNNTKENATAVAGTSKLADNHKKLADAEKRRLDQLLEEGKRLTESLDPLVKRNNELERYQKLLSAGAIDDGIFNAASQKATEDYLRALGFIEKETEEIINQTDRLGKKSVQVFDSMEQIAIQGARNIQSAFADGLFNFFDDGLKGMLRSVKAVVGRIAAEFASIKILQGAGGLLGLGGASSAFASGGGGGIGGMLNLASLGSGAMNMFKTGFGATNLVGGGLSSLGGASSLGSFGAGMQGGSAGASFIAAESAAAGAGSAAGMGASFAAAAGPLIAAYATTALFRSFAGDKRMGGGFGKGLNAIGDTPIIGDFIPVVPLMNALFGRGPLKQGMTSLRGEIGNDGFESGGIRTRFDAKGGLLRSNKNDFTNIDAVTGQITTDNKKLNDYANSISKASSEIIKSINETVSGVSSGLFDIADSMGLSTDALENFSTQIKVVSEAGKFLDQEKIAEEIARITNEMASTLIPGLEDFSKAGESALATLQRLSSEFDTLVNAATILGLSLAESRNLIQNASITDRTAFVDASGGLEALAQKASFFADNFLTDAERLAPAIELLNEQMGDLGFSANITKEEFRNLVQSFGQTGGVTEETFRSLLSIAPLFVRVKDGINGMNGALAGTLELTERISNARNALITVYNRERSALQETALRFKELGFTLRDASDSLALSSLSPLTPEQKLDEARTQFNRDRLAANQGDQEALRRLPESGRAFLEASRVFNASSTEFTSDFRFVQGVLESAANLADVEAGVAEKQLARLEDQISQLIEIDESVHSVEDAIRELTEAVLQGGGNPGITDQQIREFVNTPGRTNQEIINAAVKYGISDDQYAKATGANLSDISVATGGASISDQQIRDFFYANISNPRMIYDTAKSYGISLKRVASAAGYSYADIEQWAAQNKLPMFEKGTDFVQKGGMAMLHPAEAVTPASHMRDMAKEISDLRKELSELRREQNQQTQALINVNLEANKLNANMIIASNKDAQKSAAWRENNKVNVR